MGQMGLTLGLQTTVMNIAVIGNRVLGALTLTLFTLLTLLKRLTLLALGKYSTLSPSLTGSCHFYHRQVI